MSRILIVEDDADIAQLVKMYLEKAGHLVDVIFCLEPAWNPTDDASKQEIRLKILHMEGIQH